MTTVVICDWVLVSMSSTFGILIFIVVLLVIPVYKSARKLLYVAGPVGHPIPLPSAATTGKA